ncbi:MAG: glycosyltransferase family 4 protein [bacterium]|nr:glycosyltransferase family 4 protein [bacterium]
MKIFFITSKLNFKTSGGSVEEIDYIMKTFAELGNEVTAVTVFSYMNDIPGPRPYKVIEEKLMARRLLEINYGIYKILKKYENQADIFQVDAHISLYGAGFYRLLGGKTPVVGLFNQFLTCWPQWVSSLFKQPKINIFLAAKSKLRWMIEKYIGLPIANKIDMIAFVSPALRKMYEDFGIRHEARDLVLGDPIDIKKIMAINNIGPESYLVRNKKNGPFTLFFSSRMSPGKGFDILLAGFSKVKNKENFRLILGGMGPEQEQVRQMVKDLNLQKYVTLPGWVPKDQLFRQYQQTDIFIQADWWPAGTSISLYYAMALGVPSILPAGGGLEWQAGGSALTFKYRDTDALAAAIERLGADYDLRAALSRQCFLRLADDEMNCEKNIQKLNERMKDLVKA